MPCKQVLEDGQPENVMPLPPVISGGGLKSGKTYCVCDANRLEKVAKICHQHLIFLVNGNAIIYV